MNIRKGMTKEEIASLLVSKGLVEDRIPSWFRPLYTSDRYPIQPGSYTLNTAQTPEEMLAVMTVQPETEEETTALALHRETESGERRIREGDIGGGIRGGIYGGVVWQMDNERLSIYHLRSLEPERTPLIAELKRTRRRAGADHPEETASAADADRDEPASGFLRWGQRPLIRLYA